VFWNDLVNLLFDGWDGDMAMIIDRNDDDHVDVAIDFAGEYEDDDDDKSEVVMAMKIDVPPILIQMKQCFE
jgi:hypothetical protein